ncbi:hypothetical protein DESUT3_28340 [Desulfuromonas versatilis]|uniref:Type II secretion system protein PulP n=1 Tax=Desulfuromonas versatilis TaxID=2802975 RepID=A0ABN6E085_9BACT|nr:hypothetical protein [Desulfuromonas versatilis]BCR05765.1 hypothetical protein DESUT3_28340 [Desulfuromonas versatilis]
MKRQRLVLATLVGILVLALVYAFWATPRQQRVAATGAAEQPRSGTPGTPAPGSQAPDGLRLDLLDREILAFGEPRRDIFNAWDVPPPPPPPPPPQAIRPPAPAPPRPVVPSVPVAAPRQLARFDYLGYLEKEGVKTVFLSQQNELFVVREGTRFGGKSEFLVTGISSEALTIEQQGVTGVITVALKEETTGPTSFKAPRGGGVAAPRVPGGRSFAPVPSPAPAGGAEAPEEYQQTEEAFGQPPEPVSPADQTQAPAATPTPLPTPIMPPPVPAPQQENGSSGILQPLPASPVVKPYGE